MSSRVRFMLQDYNTGTSSVGKTAWTQLQALYTAWEKEETKGRSVTKMLWKKTTSEYAAAHPFTCTRRQEPDKYTDWEGPGLYMKTYDAVQEAGKQVPPLPAGPRWRVALEMWTRLQQGTQGLNYKFFLSRDSRKHAWRKSLCNPWHQQFGWRPKKVVAKKPKRVAATSNSLTAGDFWLEREARIIGHGQAGQAGQGVPPTKPLPVKPRVGIWS